MFWNVIISNLREKRAEMAFWELTCNLLSFCISCMRQFFLHSHVKKNPWFFCVCRISDTEGSPKISLDLISQQKKTGLQQEDSPDCPISNNDHNKMTVRTMSTEFKWNILKKKEKKNVEFHFGLRNKWNESNK